MENMEDLLRQEREILSKLNEALPPEEEERRRIEWQQRDRQNRETKQRQDAIRERLRKCPMSAFTVGEFLIIRRVLDGPPGWASIWGPVEEDALLALAERAEAR